MATPITYVGKRERYVDGLYGTGSWVRGQTKQVSDDVSGKMLRHIDQYALGTIEKPKPEKAPAAPEGSEKGSKENGDQSGIGDLNPEGKKDGTDSTDNSEEVVGGKKENTKGDDEAAMQEARDSVAYMEKDALVDYAKTHFRQSLDKRKSTEMLRQQVVGLIDQYGLT